MKICITGKPCSGKSLVMEYLSKKGYRTFIADDYVHAIYKVGQIGYNTIKKHFGDKYVTKEEVNRKELGSLVFSNKYALKKLNNLINPLIREEIESLDKNQNWFIELATYIFYPQEFTNLFDKTILIFRDQKLKKNFQNEKFSHLKKIPTIFVEKSKKVKHSILYIDSIKKNGDPINVDIFVNNCGSKTFLLKNILKILKHLF